MENTDVVSKFLDLYGKTYSSICNLECAIKGVFVQLKYTDLRSKLRSYRQ